MNAQTEAHGITTELLLEVFDIPVSFHRCLVPVTGGITSALMLSQAIWTTHALEPAAEGWFMRSQEEWTEERPGCRAGSKRLRGARCVAQASWKSVGSVCRQGSGSGSAPRPSGVPYR